MYDLKRHQKKTCWINKKTFHETLTLWMSLLLQLQLANTEQKTWDICQDRTHRISTRISTIQHLSGQIIHNICWDRTDMMSATSPYLTVITQGRKKEGDRQVSTCLSDRLRTHVPKEVNVRWKNCCTLEFCKRWRSALVSPDWCKWLLGKPAHSHPHHNAWRVTTEYFLLIYYVKQDTCTQLPTPQCMEGYNRMLPTM